MRLALPPLLLLLLLAERGSGQHGSGTNTPNGGIDLGALLGGGGGPGGKGGSVCPKGQVLAPKPEYKPAVNGCGPTGMRNREGDKWRLHECCNGHDTCYAACGTSFSYCEKQFDTCLKDMCKTVDGGARCLETASSFSSMTRAFGSSFHANGMREACDCVPKKDAPRRYEEYVTHLYERYNKRGLLGIPAVGACKDEEEDDGVAAGCKEDGEALLKALLAKYEGKEGKLFWRLGKTYEHLLWTTDGPEALSREQCKIV